MSESIVWDFAVEPSTAGRALFDLIRRLNIERLSVADSTLPFTMTRFLMFFTASITLFSMYDSSNPMIILFSADFIQAVNCTAVHVLDIPSFAANYVSFLYPFRALNSLTYIVPTWSSPGHCIVLAHNRKHTFTVEEYLHKLVVPTKELVNLIRFQSKKKTICFRSKKLKLLRLIRSVARYAQDRQLFLPGSYKNSIFCCDERLKVCLDVRYFHLSDLPFILYQKCSSTISQCA